MEFQIEIGCPQGSVLSAFLWIVLIDEIFYLSFPFSVFIIAYADDLTVGVSDADPAAATRKLEKACKLIVNWLSSIKLDVNAPKTAFLLFDWIKSNPTLSLSINLLDVVIPASVSTVYLGLTIDCHLSWNQHITSKCSSLGRLLFSLKQCLALTWGLNRQRLQSLYHLIAEPTILYACSFWAAAGCTKSQVKKLRSAQRRFSILILRAFRTSSTEGLLLLSGLTPIDYRLREITSIRFLQFSNTLSFCPSSAKIANFLLRSSNAPAELEILQRAHFQNYPPWSSRPLPIVEKINREPILPLAASGPSAVNIYTDGSVINESVGFAIAVADQNDIIYKLQVSLPKHCSAYQAECCALRQALQWINQTAYTFETYNIYSDSSTALAAATSTNCSKQPLLINEIKRLLLEMNDRIILHWLPSHCGHVGNELADKLAKEAAQQRSMPETILPACKNYVKTIIRKQQSINWNQEWSKCKTGRTTWSFFPTSQAAQILNHVDVPYQVTQLLTGHCQLNSYLHRFKLTSSPLCECAAKEEEDVEHFILRCKEFEDCREELKIMVRLAGENWPPSLTWLCASSDLLLALKRFIITSKRLTRTPRLSQPQSITSLLPS